jgi:hypothetical protein
VEVQWNNIKKCVSDTVSDLVGDVEARASKSWITKEMKWKIVNNKKGRKNCRRL